MLRFFAHSAAAPASSLHGDDHSAATQIPVFSRTTASKESNSAPVPALTETEQERLAELRASEPWTCVSEHVDHWQHHVEERIPAHPLDHVESYWLDHYREFCDDACLIRYLRARNWNVEQAKHMLLDTLLWRRHYKPHLIDPHELEAEASSGKNYWNGLDRLGRPVFYLRPHRENSSDHFQTIRLMIFKLEQITAHLRRRSLAEGETDAARRASMEKVLFLFDFGQFSAKTTYPMHVNKYFLHLLSAHYPERLGALFACNAPWYFWTFYKMASPLIPPVTKERVRFVDTTTMQAKIPTLQKEHEGIWSNLYLHVDKEQLESDFGGSLRFEYNHDLYWPMFLQHVREEKE